MSNSLTVEQLRSQLEALGVDSRGHRKELRSRLKRQDGPRQNGPSIADAATSWRKAGLPWSPQIDSYLVLDVEATCEAVRAGQSRKSSFEFPNESE